MTLTFFAAVKVGRSLYSGNVGGCYDAGTAEDWRGLSTNCGVNIVDHIIGNVRARNMVCSGAGISNIDVLSSNWGSPSKLRRGRLTEGCERLAVVGHLVRMVIVLGLMAKATG